MGRFIFDIKSHIPVPTSPRTKTLTAVAPDGVAPLTMGVSDGVMPVNTGTYVKKVGKFIPSTKVDELEGESAHIFNAFVDAWLTLNGDDAFVDGLATIFEGHYSDWYYDEFGEKEYYCVYCKDSWDAPEKIEHRNECPVIHARVIANRRDIGDVTFHALSTTLQQRRQDESDMIGMFIDFYDALIKTDRNDVFMKLATLVTNHAISVFYDGAGYVSDVGTTSYDCECCSHGSDDDIDAIPHTTHCAYMRMEKFLSGEI